MKMAKIFIAIAALLATSLAEPPVGSYLPPGQSAQPSNQYGAPDSFSGGFGSKSVSKSYESPSTSLESHNSRNAQAPSSAYGVPGNSFGNGFSQPSNTYGAPDQFSSDFGSESVVINAAPRFGSFGGSRQLSSTYGAPSQQFEQQPSRSYGAPARSSASFGGSSGSGQAAVASSRFAHPSSAYGAPSRSAQPSNTYGTPNGLPSNGASVRSFGGSNSHGASSGQAAGRYTAAIPSSSYGAPSNGFDGGLSRSYSAPSTSYGAPANGFSGGFARSSQSSFSASTSYSAPSNHIDAGYTRQLSNEYGAPGYAYKAATEDPLAEPAHYQYNYEVRDEEQISGTEFGHQESRENEAARGVYHVLLPDGRMQIVEYEADERGYRPNIRYEETGAYPSARSGQNGQGGY